MNFSFNLFGTDISGKIQEQIIELNKYSEKYKGSESVKFINKLEKGNEQTKLNTTELSVKEILDSEIDKIMNSNNITELTEYKTGHKNFITNNDKKNIQQNISKIKVFLDNIGKEKVEECICNEDVCTSVDKTCTAYTNTNEPAYKTITYQYNQYQDLNMLLDVIEITEILIKLIDLRIQQIQKEQKSNTIKPSSGGKRKSRRNKKSKKHRKSSRKGRGVR